VIGQAIGIVMERYQLDEDKAFGFIIRLSQSENIKARVIAEQLVTEANEAARTQHR
jgi:AmiR/NasT family two-component response regulator